MARVKLGGLAQDVRGSLNGSVFSRNRGGAYVRTKVSPVQPVSVFASNSRQSFKIISQNWASALTAGERAGWIAFAGTHPYINVFGDPLIVSGIAMFQGLNKRLQQLGFDTFADAPPSITVDPPGVIAPNCAIASPTNISIAINAMNPPSGGTVSGYLWATKVLPPGRNPSQSDFRLINNATGTVFDESENWGAQYLARMYPYAPAAGDNIAFRYAYIDTNDGAISVVSEARVAFAAIPGPLIPLVASELATNVATYYCSEPHNLSIGDEATTVGCTNSIIFNNVAPVASVPSASSFTTDITHANVAFGAETGTAQRTA